MRTVGHWRKFAIGCRECNKSFSKGRTDLAKHLLGPSHLLQVENLKNQALCRRVAALEVQLNEPLANR